MLKIHTEETAQRLTQQLPLTAFPPVASPPRQ
jgi:hypothetical protein